MFTQKENAERQVHVVNLDVIDLVILDHQFLRTCLEVLGNIEESMTKRKAALRKFINLYRMHARAEKMSIYIPLRKNEEVHFHVLEAESTHIEIEQKMRFLKRKFAETKELVPEIMKEVQFLTVELLKHLQEEEDVLLPRLKEDVEDHVLQDIGAQFMKYRKFTTEELECLPIWNEDLIHWEDAAQKISSKLLAKMAHDGVHQ